ERIARRARRHGRLQPLAIETAGYLRAHCLDGGRYPRDRLAVARVGHAFAAAVMGAVGELGDDHDGLGLGAAADGEWWGDGPALQANAEGGGAHWDIFYLKRKPPTTMGHGADVANDAPSPSLDEVSRDAAHGCLRRDRGLRDCGRGQYTRGRADVRGR